VLNEFASGVGRLAAGLANVYFVGERGGPWAVVDTSTKGEFEAIRAAAEKRYGADARPEAILLTHGHPDHSGSALALAVYWNVPVYIHKRELPYVTGRAEYPPPDPTVGGFLGMAVRFVNTEQPDLTGYVNPLPDDGTVPGLPGWTWVHSPGHAPGNVTFWREEGRIALVGDALATVDLDDFNQLIVQAPRLSRPPAPTTVDWLAARKSILRIAALEPLALGAGHGVPIVGNLLGTDLTMFGEDFIIPLKGRYVSDPVRFNENGIEYLPPIVPDPLPKRAAGIGLAALGVGLGVYLWRKKRAVQGKHDGAST
jgi:glyoxylase-like metal-dependent hydrolase (beta-lactamase superfamily II)